MNDKQQLAAMGEHMASMKLTIHGHGINSEEEASGGFLTRCLPCSSQQQQTPCMAKRIEELEAQVRVMNNLVDRMVTMMVMAGDEAESESFNPAKAWMFEAKEALSGNLPIHSEQPLAMVQGGDGSRDLFERWFRRDYHPDRQGPYIKDITWAAWQAALAATQSPDAAK